MRASSLIPAAVLVLTMAGAPAFAYEEEHTRSESTYRSNDEAGDTGLTRDREDRNSDVTVERRSTTIEQQAVTPSVPTPPAVVVPAVPQEQPPTTTYEEHKSLSIGK